MVRVFFLLLPFFPRFFLSISTQLTRLLFSKSAEITKRLTVALSPIRNYFCERTGTAGSRHDARRDIIPRGARPSSSINASTLLTLPQIRRRAEGVVSAVFLRRGGRKGVQYLGRDQRERISCNYGRIRISVEDEPRQDGNVDEFIAEVFFSESLSPTNASLFRLLACSSMHFFLPSSLSFSPLSFSQSFHQLR